MPAPRRGVLLHVLGGWEAHGILQSQTGFPFNPRVGFDQARMRSGFGDLDQRPSLSHGPGSVVLGDPSRYFDPLAFTLPAAGFLGNLGRNTVTGPGLFTLSLGLHKSLWRSESHTLRLRMEAFNATNRPNFDIPSELRLFASSGGRVGSAAQITTTSTPARQVQLAMRWEF